jgi:hypothetical protein
LNKNVYYRAVEPGSVCIHFHGESR